MARNLVVAVDGSDNSMKSLDYISMLFGGAVLEVDLLYVMPALPPLFDDPAVRRQAKKQLEAIEQKNRELGGAVLEEAKQRMVKAGFDSGSLRVHLEPKQQGPARDICHFAGRSKARAIVVGARGRSRLERFFTGSVSGNIIQYSKTCPVWIVNGDVKSKKVLIAIDASGNAMNAVDHAAGMLADTPAEITLFHTTRDLSRFIPPDVLDAAPDLEELWQTKAGEQIAPFMQKAMERLKAAGIGKELISKEIIHGSRSPADDITKHARKNGFGTVVLGRHGQSDKKEYAMGGVTGKVIQDSANLAVWIC